MAQRSATVVVDDVMGGQPRIEGHRITVLQIHDLVEERGIDPQTVADRYDLDVAAVYRALAYYHEHPDTMHAARTDRDQQIQNHRDRGLTPDDLE